MANKLDEIYEYMLNHIMNNVYRKSYTMNRNIRFLKSVYIALFYHNF